MDLDCQSETDVESPDADMDWPDETALHGVSLLEALRARARNASVHETDLVEALSCLTALACPSDYSDTDEGRVFDWASTVVSALEHGIGYGSRWDVLHLFGPQFLQALFSLRQKYRPTGHQSQQVVTFADIIMTLLFPSATLGPAGDSKWNTILEEERLRAAATLPEQLSQLAECMDSISFSPGTRRLSLSILWGMHVFWNWDSEAMGNIQAPSRRRVAVALEAFVDKSESEGTSAPRECYDYAYVLGLTSVTMLPEGFRPSFHSALLRMLSVVLQQSKPLTEDGADLESVMLLVKYGNFTSWSWKLWGVHGEGAELVQKLTEHWLVGSFVQNPDRPGWTSRLEECCAETLPVLLRVLKHAAHTSTHLLRALFTAFVTVPGLTEDSAAVLDVMQSGNRLMSSECDVSVKELIVQLLSLANERDVESLLQSPSSKQIVGDCLSFVARAVLDGKGDDDERTVGLVKPVLDFICLLARFKCAADAIRLHPSFVQKISEWSCAERLLGCSMTFATCGPPVVLLIGLLAGHETERISFGYAGIKIHETVLGCGPEDIALAGRILRDISQLCLSPVAVFARYTIEILPRKKPSHLTCLELWSYFSDSLLLILGGHDFSDYTELAYLSFSSLMQALEAILDSLDPGSARFVLSSDWTVLVAKGLQSMTLLSLDPTQELLAINQIAAASLLEKIKITLQPTSTESSSKRTSGRPREVCLGYGEIDGSMRVIYVPVERRDQSPAEN